VLIAATNRPQDLDAALLSRFELSIAFPLPEPAARKGIFALYARHLDNSALDRLASISDGASGRDIRDVCEAAERRWAARRVRKESVAAGQPLPPIEEYAACMQQRSATLRVGDACGAHGGLGGCDAGRYRLSHSTHCGSTADTS